MSYTQSGKGGKEFLLKLGNGLVSGSSVTFQNTGDTVTQTAHGLVNGQLVNFLTVVTTTTITVATNYYVIGATANTFQVALTPGGTAVAVDADGTGTIDESFQTLGGLRTSSFSIKSDGIDITNHESGEWMELLSGAGIRSVELSGEGVFVDDVTLGIARSLVLSRLLRNWRICVNSTPSYWEGCFRINSLEQSGGYDGEQTYSVGMASAGPVSYTV